MRRAYRIVVERDVEVNMKDGTRSYCDIYRPDKDGKFPIILVRTPYNKGAVEEEFFKLLHQLFLTL